MKEFKHGTKLTRAELKEVKGGYEISLDDGGYRCKSGSCNLYDSSTGVTESGDCGWDLSGNPTCHCKTSNHPNAVPIKGGVSVCVQYF